MVAGSSEGGGGNCRMRSISKHEDRHAASYKRIAKQCDDAQRQVERRTISIEAAGEIIRLARLLLRSVDLHRQRSAQASPARDQRIQAQNALRRLRRAICQV